MFLATKLNLTILFFLLIFQGCGSINHKKEVAQNSSDEFTEESLASLKKQLKEKVDEVLTKEKIERDYLGRELYLKASAYDADDNFRVANIYYEELMRIEREDELLQKRYVVSLIRAGELQKSKELLISLLNLPSQKKFDPKLALVLAGVYSSLDESENAKKTYLSILKNYKGEQDACIFLSKLYLQEGSKKSAISLLQNCEKNNKKVAAFSYYIGRIHLENRNYKKAISEFNRSIKLEPDFYQAVLAKGLILEEEGKTEEAIKTYKDFLKINNYRPEILNRIVQVMFTSEKFKEVIPYAERLADLEPDNLNLRVKLGILYSDNKEYENALSIFKSILKEAPTSDKILYYVGAIYQEIKSFDNAIEAFGSIPESSGLYQDSTIQIANMLSALALTNSDKEKEFVSFIDKREKILKGMALDLAIIKANYFEEVGKVKEAISSLDQFKKKDDFKESHKYYLASLYEKARDFKSSSKLILEIVSVNPNNAHAWNFLGYSLVERGEDLDLAHDYIQKAIKLSPEDGYIRDTLGWYYFKKGEILKALTELQAAAKLVPDDVSIQKHLALTYAHLEKFSEAKKYFVKAITISIDENEKAELNNLLMDVSSNRIPASFQIQN